jgi:hypothetical protein
MNECQNVSFDLLCQLVRVREKFEVTYSKLGLGLLGPLVSVIQLRTE